MTQREGVETVLEADAKVENLAAVSKVWLSLGTIILTKLRPEKFGKERKKPGLFPEDPEGST